MSDLALATVSEHLKVLRKAGVLILDRQGRFWFYRTDHAVIRLAADALHRIGQRPDQT